MSLLEINNLNISFDTNDGVVKAVNDVSFNLGKNESLAIVGESGSGKTQLVFSILDLLAKNAKVSGSIKYESNEILDLSENGKQPMINKDNTVVISVNGEIYNHKKIRDNSNILYNYTTNSDCEVILSLYKNKGINFLNDLSGIFAFALYGNTLHPYT